MQVIVVLLIASVVVAAGFLVAFLWTAHRGQYEDLETPPVRMLYDDIEAGEKATTTNSSAASQNGSADNDRSKSPDPLLRPSASASTSLPVAPLSGPAAGGRGES